MGAREEFSPDRRLYDPPVLPWTPGRLHLQKQHVLPLRGRSDFAPDPAWEHALAEIRGVPPAA